MHYGFHVQRLCTFTSVHHGVPVSWVLCTKTSCLHKHHNLCPSWFFVHHGFSTSQLSCITMSMNHDLCVLGFLCIIVSVHYIPWILYMAIFMTHDFGALWLLFIVTDLHGELGTLWFLYNAPWPQTPWLLNTTISVLHDLWTLWLVNIMSSIHHYFHSLWLSRSQLWCIMTAIHLDFSAPRFLWLISVVSIPYISTSTKAGGLGYVWK